MMFGSSILKKTLATATLALGLFLTGCFSDHAGPSAGDDRTAVIAVRAAIPQQAKLAKSSVISLDKLVLTLVSNVGDTLRDTITQSTIPALSASVAASQTVGKYYAVNPLRQWKLSARTLDVNDSVIHDSSTAFTPVLLVGDTVQLSLSLDARFVMYVANFLNLPDSVGSATPGTAKQKIYFHRLVMNIDDADVRDSSRTYFTGSPVLEYDYVPVGPRTVKLRVYGFLDGMGPADVLLYSDSTAINVGSGQDSTITRNLTYVGPGAGGNGGVGDVSVTIGKVGTITINGNIPANPFE